MTRVAIHQPQYLPWVPYCTKAEARDLFVYLDNVQFQRRGVQNRNQIKNAQGSMWLTVPVTARRTTGIAEVRVADKKWQMAHIRSIRENYARASYLHYFTDGLKPILEQDWTFLVDLNMKVTEWMFDALGITCRQIRAGDLDVGGTKDDLIIDICKAVGGDIYVSGEGARAYQGEEEFLNNGLELRYLSYRTVSYPQCHPNVGFVPDLSALDLILNMGPHAREVLLEGFKG